MSQDKDLALALELADRADAVTMDRFGALDLRIDTKPDLTPVTDADRSAETTLRDALAQSAKAVIDEALITGEGKACRTYGPYQASVVGY